MPSFVYPAVNLPGYDGLFLPTDCPSKIQRNMNKIKRCQFLKGSRKRLVEMRTMWSEESSRCLAKGMRAIRKKHR